MQFALCNCAAVATPFADSGRATQAAQVSSQLHLEAVDPLADRAALERLAQWCEQFTPVVGLEDSAAPESLLLDVTGCEQLWKSATAMAERVADSFRRRGLVARVAVADTIGAAWALAHVVTCSASGSPATCSAVVLPHGDVAAALRPMPVEALRAADDVVLLLRELGVETIGQLESLPRSSVAARFGPRLLERLDQAMGRAAELIVPHRLPPAIEADWSFECPVSRHDVLDRVLERLIGDVTESLARRGSGAVQLDCRLESDGGEPVVVPVRLVRPTASARHLLELIRLQLERIQLSGSISAVRVRVTSSAALEHDQFELFDSGTDPQAPRELAALVDRLSNRLGRESVARVRLVPDAQPEATYRYEPLIGSGVRHFKLQSSPPRRLDHVRNVARRRLKFEVPDPGASGGVDCKADEDRRDRRVTCERSVSSPIRLCPRPEPITVVSAVPDGPPARFDWAGERHCVVQAVGPERIETGWWRGRPVPARRDYYRVETDAGRRFWLFRRLDDGRWFLHGWFD